MPKMSTIQHIVRFIANMGNPDQSMIFFVCVMGINDIYPRHTDLAFQELANILGMQ